MADKPRILTQRELNRALLARQLLLERARMSLPRALERMAGLQAQYAPSMYIGLWSRIAGFERDQLTRALERRSVVQGTLMRATIHLVSAGDYWAFAAGIRQERRNWWLRVHRGQVKTRSMTTAAKKLRGHLKGGPLNRREIEDLLGKPSATSAGIWLDLVRVPPSGTWERRRADLYAAAEDWLGPESATSEEGVTHLVRRYLRGFGPAPVTDIADWAGLPVVKVKSAIERLGLRRFETEDGKELLDLPRAPLPGPDVSAPVRFLPTWDATLLAHARRTGILPEAVRPHVFNTKTPHSVPTFLVDGVVAGTWREEGGRLRIEPFESLTRRVRAELADEIAQLERLFA